MEHNIFESKLFKIIILSVAGLIILVFVFALGVFVGTKRADFSFQWADQYHRNFGGPQGGLFGDMMGEDFTNSNGVFGPIIKIDGKTLTVNGTDNVEKVILVDNKTIIRFQRKNEKLSDLKVGDSIIVTGEPNDKGQIEALLIRVIPAPPKSSSKTSAASNAPVVNTNTQSN